MGTVDSGDLPQSFDKVETNCDNTGEKMVQLMECQNTQTSSSNGVYQITSSMANNGQEHDKGLLVVRGLPTKEDNAGTKENAQNNKRKLDEDIMELNNKRAKSSEFLADVFENTGRGKRIKKIKKPYCYDDVNDEADTLKKSDKRFFGDAEDKEYIPPFKMPRLENGLATASSTFTLAQQSSLDANFDLLSSQVKLEHRKIIDKEEMNAANKDEEAEDLTIIEMSDEEANELPIVRNHKIELSKNIDTSSQESTGNKFGGVYTDISIAIETYNSPDTCSRATPLKPSVITPVYEDLIANQPDSQSTLIHHINTLVNSKYIHNPHRMMKPPFVAETYTNCITSSKPLKKVFKKSSKKNQKKNNRPDFLDEAELKHINKLKSQTSKKQGHDGCKQTTGPYIQCKGQRDSLKLCRVINVKDSQDEHGSSNPTKYSMIPSETCCPNASSRMSNNVPWNCILCSNGSNYMSLGDLFGPYFPQKSSQTSTGTNVEPVKSLDQNNDSKHQYKPERSLSGLHSNGLPSEIWIHGDCAIWTNGILASGGRLRGLEEAALAAQQSVCSSCDKKGATLGCLAKGCQLNYHYLCACQTGCTFQEDNYSILCPNHKNYRINRPSLISEPVIGLTVS